MAGLDPEQVRQFIRRLDPDERTEVFGLLDDETRDQVLQTLGEERREKLEFLLKFISESVAGLMDLNYVTVRGLALEQVSLFNSASSETRLWPGRQTVPSPGYP